MRREWRTPSVWIESLKFVNYTIVESAHNVSKKNFVLLCGCYMYNSAGGKEQLRACVDRYDQSA